MMKKVIMISALLAGTLFLAGCHDDHDDVIIVNPGPAPGPEYVTLFLVDNLGLGVQYVPYTCYGPSGAIVENDVTLANGEFTFVPGDRCEFDLYGFNGSITMPIYITDDLRFGKADIPYECDNSVVYTDGLTDIDGYFEYPMDAFCKFYL